VTGKARVDLVVRAHRQYCATALGQQLSAEGDEKSWLWQFQNSEQTARISRSDLESPGSLIAWSLHFIHYWGID
jgi:hypothetical protein